jgi:hypothetical protein
MPHKLSSTEVASRRALLSLPTGVDVRTDGER